MARDNGIAFLGRVPIDTILVGLLDAVSKGEVEATGLGEEKKEMVSFPLLDRYWETASSTVWKGIAEGVVRRIDERRADFVEAMQLSA